MKKISKILIKKIAKILVSVMSTNRVGRYFAEHFAKFIFDQKETVIHNGLSLSFYCPNIINKLELIHFQPKSQKR